MKQSAKIVRQGDVLLIAVSSLPSAVTKKVRENGRVVLAHGEVTGHSHSIVEKKVIHYDAPDAVQAAEALLASVGLNRELTVANAPTFLSVEAPAEIVHEEHGTIPLETGTYVVIRQREWSDSDEPRQVAD